MPTRRRISSSSFSSTVSMPSTYTLPPEGSSTALKVLASVDLPLPLWPRMTVKLPRSMASVTPSSASVGCSFSSPAG